jgi:hypothetical protein
MALECQALCRVHKTMCSEPPSNMADRLLMVGVWMTVSMLGVVFNTVCCAL